MLVVPTYISISHVDKRNIFEVRARRVPRGS